MAERILCICGKFYWDPVETKHHLNCTAPVKKERKVKITADLKTYRREYMRKYRARKAQKTNE